jgi:hypothetical protein
MATSSTPDHHTPVDGVDPNQYRWHLTRAHVDKVLHYTHWIPVSKGFTQQFLAHDYPGWTLGTLVGLFDTAGIRIAPCNNEDAAGAPHGGRCHWQVVAFYFNHADDFHVVWNRDLPFDTDYLGLECDGAPGGTGPLGGRKVAAVQASRPVDLSGEQFFDDRA